MQDAVAAAAKMVCGTPDAVADKVSDIAGPDLIKADVQEPAADELADVEDGREREEVLEALLHVCRKRALLIAPVQAVVAQALQHEEGDLDASPCACMCMGKYVCGGAGVMVVCCVRK